jgi:alpha-1,3-rhamnosyl/mannosyltransferase
MRVGFDGRCLIGPGGGIGRYARALLEAVTRLAPEHTLHLLFLGRDGARPAFEGRAVSWGGRTGLGARLLAIGLEAGLVPGAAVEDYLGPVEVFHAPNYILLPQRAGGRVVTVHDLTVLRFPRWHPWLRVQRFRLGLRRSVARADRILVDSEATRADCIRLLRVPEGKLRVVPLAPTLAPPADAAEAAAVLARHGLERDGYLLFVGTLEPRKNLVRLIDAHARAAGGPGKVAPLLLVGRRGWGDRAILRRLEAPDVAGRVRWLGSLPDGQVAALLGGARLFLYPSLSEGFGLPVLEAMAAGAPVVASRASALPEVAGDAALLVDPEDVEAIAAAIRRGLDDPALRAELRARGLARAAGFSWAETARRTLAVYREATAIASARAG